MKGRGKAGKGELDEQLREYINEWRSQRAKEEEELKRLKEKQAKRKEIRAEQEKKLAAQKVIIIHNLIIQNIFSELQLKIFFILPPVERGRGKTPQRGI